MEREEEEREEDEMAYMICGTGKHRYGDEYRGECPYCHVPCYPGEFTISEVEARNQLWFKRAITSIDKKLEAKLQKSKIVDKLPHLPWDREIEQEINKSEQKNSQHLWTKVDLRKLKKLWDKNGASTLVFWSHEAEKRFGRSLSSVEHQLRVCIHDKIFEYVLEITPEGRSK